MKPTFLKRTKSPVPTFERARRYRPPPTSFHGSIQAIYEEFGSPRTSKQVKQAYYDSHPNSDDYEQGSSRYHSADHSTHSADLVESFATTTSATPATSISSTKENEQPDPGIAGEQGAKLRQSAESQTEASASKGSDDQHICASSQTLPGNSASQPVSRRESSSYDSNSRRTSRVGQESSATTEEKVDASAGSVASQGDAVIRGQKSELSGKGETFGKGSPSQPENYPTTGIDNLALLMEDDSFSAACFSIYMFKTELEMETVHHFFQVLAETYPKYRYAVDLDPKASIRKENEMRKPEMTEKQPAQHTLDSGRRTKYGKGLKAGSLFRPARWRLVSDFDVKDNIQYFLCPPDGGSDMELNKLAGDFLARHFDYSKPVWEALVVHGLTTSDGGKSALMIKIHHCFSDGQGMIQSYHAALGALEQGIGIRDIQRKVDSSHVVKKPGQREVNPTLWGSIKHGVHTIRGLYFKSRKSFRYQHNVPRVSGRLYCHSEGIGMQDIKLIRKAFSTPKINLSLNDVACAILARSLRIAAERTEPSSKVKDKRVAIFVPISVRSKGDWSLSNQTTGSIAWFRFDNLDFEQQLNQVHGEMNRIKRSHLPQITFTLFNKILKARINYLPNYPLARSFHYKACREYHVATNVPGPSKPVKFGNHEAYSYHVLPPSSPGKATMAIGMISYANDFSIAVSCDQVAEFNQLPQEICKAFQEAAIQIVNAAKIKLGQEK